MKKRCYIICCISLCISLGCSLVYGQETSERDTVLKTLLQKIADTFSTSEARSGQDTLESVTTRIVKEFDTWLECPECYRDKALEECAVFPEGRIYSFAIPALGYANLAIKNPHMKAHALEQMRTLIIC